MSFFVVFSVFSPVAETLILTFDVNVNPSVNRNIAFAEAPRGRSMARCCVHAYRGVAVRWPSVRAGKRGRGKGLAGGHALCSSGVSPDSGQVKNKETNALFYFLFVCLITVGMPFHGLPPSTAPWEGQRRAGRRGRDIRYYCTTVPLCKQILGCLKADQRLEGGGLEGPDRLEIPFLFVSVFFFNKSVVLLAQISVLFLVFT